MRTARVKGFAIRITPTILGVRKMNRGVTSHEKTKQDGANRRFNHACVPEPRHTDRGHEVTEGRSMSREGDHTKKPSGHVPKTLVKKMEPKRQRRRESFKGAKGPANPGNNSSQGLFRPALKSSTIWGAGVIRV